ncbi:MAG: aminoacyl-tRNA hydrolase [Candidatus Spechtbacterales bacterium]
MQNILIVGLGNPGKQYQHTPHNAGAMALDELRALLKEESIPLRETTKQQLNMHETEIAGRRVVLAKPQTFMNQSGSAVRNLVRAYPVGSLASLWVVHDDIDLALGTIRLSRGGRAAGHNGIADIIEQLGSSDFSRFRIGIRPENMPEKRSPEMMSAFVTGTLSPDRLAALKNAAHIWATSLLAALREPPAPEEPTA